MSIFFVLKQILGETLGNGKPVLVQTNPAKNRRSARRTSRIKSAKVARNVNVINLRFVFSNASGGANRNDRGQLQLMQIVKLDFQALLAFHLVKNGKYHLPTLQKQ